MVDLLNAASCAIFSFNDEGVIVQANDKLCSLVKREKSEIIGQRVNVIFTIATLIFHQTHFYPLLKVKRTIDEIFITLKTSDNLEIPVLASANRIEENGSVENVCSCLTIHKRKDYESEIIQARKEAEKALQENTALIEAKAQLQANFELLDERMFQLQQRNEELRQLNDGVSHNLQEPIRKLLFYSDMLLNHSPQLSKTDTLEKVISQTKRIKETLIALQKYVWLENESSKRTEIDLNNILLQAKQRLLTNHPTSTLVLKAKELPKVHAHPEQFVTLFYELLSNSVKFSVPEKPVHVVIDAITVHHNQFKALSGHYQYTDHYKIVYTDNSLGFNPKYKEQVFELFKKLHRESTGLGIGLTLCQKIIANHKGTLVANSTEGQGSTFTIYLPVSLP